MSFDVAVITVPTPLRDGSRDLSSIAPRRRAPLRTNVVGQVGAKRYEASKL